MAAKTCMVFIFLTLCISNFVNSIREVRPQILNKCRRSLEDDRDQIVANDNHRIRNLKDDITHFDEDEDQFHRNLGSFGNQQTDQFDYTVETVDVQRALNPLLKQANTASIGLLFILLIWRTLACFEMADQFQSVTMRTLTSIPAIALSCANAIGFVVNLIKPLNFKNHLKFILALNLVREGIEIVYNMYMMVFSISKETYLGRFFVNCWWFMLCYSFSRSRWVLETIIPTVRHEYQQYYQNNSQTNKRRRPQ